MRRAVMCGAAEPEGVQCKQGQGQARQAKKKKGVRGDVTCGRRDYHLKTVAN